MPTIPPFPYDLGELQHIEKLLEKMPVFEEKLAQLGKAIREVSLEAHQAGSPYTQAQEIESIIYKAFFMDAENRSFNPDPAKAISNLKTEIAHQGKILKRNIPCEICGENRSIDRCHIVPNRLGGTLTHDNLLYLCPTHHRMFDRFMLLEAEWAQIEWERKNESSQHYASSVTLEAHKLFWEKLEENDYGPINEYQQNEKPFVAYAVRKILGLFMPNRPVKLVNIKKMLDPNLHFIFKLSVPVLIEHGYLVKVTDSSSGLIMLATQGAEVDPKVILEIWQKA